MLDLDSQTLASSYDYENWSRNRCIDCDVSHLMYETYFYGQYVIADFQLLLRFFTYPISRNVLAKISG